MTSSRSASVALPWAVVDEQLRRGSARATQTIATRWGDALGMWVGCGYPKSGTVWLCQLLSSYLDLPHPRRSRAPIAMPSVVHAHWLPGKRPPRTVYIVRDGRDVMVSFYFYEVRLAQSDLNPRAARSRRERFAKLLGPRADLNDVRTHLPRFLESELERPSWMRATWPNHVAAWLDAPDHKVAVVRYEDLLESVETALAPAIEQLTHRPVDRSYLALAGARFAFARQVELSRLGEVERPHLRRGRAGDWRNHFSAEALQIFNSAGKEVLARLGYEVEVSSP